MMPLTDRLLFAIPVAGTITVMIYLVVQLVKKLKLHIRYDILPARDEDLKRFYHTTFKIQGILVDRGSKVKFKLRSSSKEYVGYLIGKDDQNIILFATDDYQLEVYADSIVQVTVINPVYETI